MQISTDLYAVRESCIVEPKIVAAATTTRISNPLQPPPHHHRSATAATTTPVLVPPQPPPPPCQIRRRPNTNEEQNTRKTGTTPNSDSLAHELAQNKDRNPSIQKSFRRRSNTEIFSSRTVIARTNRNRNANPRTKRVERVRFRVTTAALSNSRFDLGFNFGFRLVILRNQILVL
ncbi:hypothetical protein QL285_061468 [Trifolium repens]|nr:hypothetical protein QL285_061468 [Trifolium repens]